MKHIYAEEKPELSTIQHHGVKGMRWGVTRQNVRDSYAQATRNKAKAYNAVGKGTGSKRQTAKVALTTSTHNVQKHGGLKGAAKAKGESLEARAARIEKGKARISDILVAYGTVSSSQLTTAARQVKQRQSS